MGHHRASVCLAQTKRCIHFRVSRQMSGVFSIRPPDVKHDPANRKHARPAPIPLFGRGHSFAPGLHKPVLPRAGGVKDGAATAKGGLSLTAPSTVAC